MTYRSEPFVNGYLVGIAFIIFFPIGILFLLMRFISHRNNNHLKISDMKLISKILIGFWVIMCIFIILSEEGVSQDVIVGSVALFLMVGLPAVLLWFWASRKSKALQNVYDQYEELIVNQQILSVDRIAEQTGRRVNAVMNDIRHMIHIGRLDAYVDPDTRRIVFHDYDDYETDPSEPDFEEWPSADEAAAANETPKSKVVECSGCGSKSSLRPNEKKECEYCGSPIRYV